MTSSISTFWAFKLGEIASIAMAKSKEKAMVKYILDVRSINIILFS